MHLWQWQGIKVPKLPTQFNHPKQLVCSRHPGRLFHPRLRSPHSTCPGTPLCSQRPGEHTKSRAGTPSAWPQTRTRSYKRVHGGRGKDAGSRGAGRPRPNFNASASASARVVMPMPLEVNMVVGARSSVKRVRKAPRTISPWPVRWAIAAFRRQVCRMLPSWIGAKTCAAEVKFS